MFTTDPNEPAKTGIKYEINDAPSTVLVKVVPHSNATINNKASELAFTLSDVFIYLKSKYSGLEIINHLFSPERKGNLARLILRSKTPINIVTGQVVGTALLFQEENLQLVFLKAEQHALAVKSQESKLTTTIKDDEDTTTIKDDEDDDIQMVDVEAKPVKVAAGSLTSKLQRACAMLASTVLYSRIHNYVMVELKDYELTKRTRKFGEAKLTLEPDIINRVSANNQVSQSVSQFDIEDFFCGRV